jgi:hypothetical protein
LCLKMPFVDKGFEASRLLANVWEFQQEIRPILFPQLKSNTQ